MDKQNKSAEITSPDRFNEEFELAEQNLLELDPTGEGSTATELYTGLEWMRDEYKNCFDELTKQQQANAELQKLSESHEINYQLACSENKQLKESYNELEKQNAELIKLLNECEGAIEYDENINSLFQRLKRIQSNENKG